MEESANDTAHLLAALVEKESSRGVLNTHRLAGVIDRVKGHRFRAKIYGLVKEQVDLRVYVTDMRGIVVYDSYHKLTGKDYSRWNDVKRTLEGKYGARSSTSELDQKGSLFIAAPIRYGNQIIGVLTVEKPKSNVDPFISIAHNRFLQATLLFGGTILLVFTVLLVWITLPIARLTQYVRNYRLYAGNKAYPLPELGRTEIRDLGRAFESMRKDLEGKRYIENYVDTLTHAIKSPVAAIHGAAELLQDSDMGNEERQRFIGHILNESNRLNTTLQQMLHLSRLEGIDSPIKMERINLREAIEKIVELRKEVFAEKEIALRMELEDLWIQGDPFLVYQIIENILGNALEFIQQGGISLLTKREDNRIRVEIQDTGPGIPDYAISHIFEKFYSLPRPQNGKKSSGLGLSLVRIAMDLHGGDVEVQNVPGGGVCVTLLFPQ